MNYWIVRYWVDPTTHIEAVIYRRQGKTFTPMWSRRVAAKEWEKTARDKLYLKKLPTTCPGVMSTKQLSEGEVFIELL